MRAQHLLSSELLPRFQPALASDCELWCPAMRLQRMRAEHHPNLVERKPVERLPVLDRGENALCHLRHNQIFDKECFLKTERRRDAVVERDPLEQSLRKVIVQVVERPAHPHFHLAVQIDECRGERYRPRDPNAFPVVKGFPLTDCRGRKGHADQDCLIWGVHRSLLHVSRTRAKARHGELWFLIRANRPAVVGRRSENIRQRRSEHQRVRLRVANRRYFAFLSPDATWQDDRSAHSNIMDASRTRRIPRTGNRRVLRMYKSGAFSQNTPALSSRSSQVEPFPRRP